MSLTGKEFPVAAIAAAVIGSLVFVVISVVLIWKCKQRKCFSHPEPRQDPHQSIPTAGN